MDHRERIERLFDKPGRCWMPAERHHVKAWLGTDEQFRPLLFHALRHLGHGATVEDAEDAWMEYYTERLDAHINTYDPAKGCRFWNFLWLWFALFCKEKSRRLRMKAQREISTVVEGDEGRTSELESIDENEGCNPEKNVMRRQFLEALQS
jgi:hypothetical protein